MEQTEKDLLLLLRNSRVSDEYYRYLISKYVKLAREMFVGTVMRDYMHDNISAGRYEYLLGVPPSKKMRQERQQIRPGFSVPFIPNASTEFARNAFHHLLSRGKESDLKGSSS